MIEINQDNAVSTQNEILQKYVKDGIFDVKGCLLEIGATKELMDLIDSVVNRKPPS